MVIVSGVFGDALLDALRLGVVTHHPLLAQRRRDRLHLEKQAAVLLLSIYDFALGDGVEEGGVFAEAVAGGGGGACEGPHALELD